ncbi:MAG: glycosyl hydrolase family 18 protein [Minisyncoccia bacterium]
MNRTVPLVAFLFLLFPGGAFAATATPFEVSGWIPYWRAATGTAEVLSHTQNFTSIMPFGYIVQDNGSIYDAFGLNGAASSATSTAALLTETAKASHIKIVPTVMWSNGAAIDEILRSSKSRQALETNIADLANANNFDGIDIDFENKLAQTRPYFSLFLKGLYARMGNKYVYCDVEPRTPPSSLYEVIPATLDYANDYSAINKYCDRVEIMAYDQNNVDLKLDEAASTTPYVPVADPKWVTKVVNLAAQNISKKKIILGVATYGYEFDIASTSDGYTYDLDWAFDPGYATQLASEFGITPIRNIAGELSFIYTPTTTPATQGSISTTSQTAASSSPINQRIVWWSDASAVSDKIALAKKLGLRGIGIFKLDGGEDQNIWNILPVK